MMFFFSTLQLVFGVLTVRPTAQYQVASARPYTARKISSDFLSCKLEPAPAHTQSEQVSVTIATAVLIY